MCIVWMQAVVLLQSMSVYKMQRASPSLFQIEVPAYIQVMGLFLSFMYGGLSQKPIFDARPLFIGVMRSCGRKIQVQSDFYSMRFIVQSS